MARRLRLCVPGGLYHVMARGNEKKEIYLVEADWRRFLNVLGDTVARHGIVCHAYCLMSNHYHLMLEVPGANLSRAMQRLNGVYGASFNRRHGRVGHLFEGRFRDVLVEKQSHLLELTRYIVLNPVRSGVVDAPGDWPWSSYRATAGMQRDPEFLSVAWILGCFDDRDPGRARRRYREFVADGIGVDAEELPEVTTDASYGVGSRAGHLPAEAPRAIRWAGRPSLAALFSGIAGRSTRDDRIRVAHFNHGYLISEIARHLGLHRTTVGKILGRPGNRQFSV